MCFLPSHFQEITFQEVNKICKFISLHIYSQSPLRNLWTWGMLKNLILLQKVWGTSSAFSISALPTVILTDVPCFLRAHFSDYITPFPAPFTALHFHAFSTRSKTESGQDADAVDGSAVSSFRWTRPVSLAWQMPQLNIPSLYTHVKYTWVHNVHKLCGNTSTTIRDDWVVWGLD